MRRAVVALALAGLAVLAADAQIPTRAFRAEPIGPIAGRVMPDATSWASSTGVVTWQHTPFTAPQGAILLTMTSNNIDQISTATYGGVTMTEQTSAVDTIGEAVRITLFFLGAGLPSGEQTVQINRTATTLTVYGYLLTVTASGDVELADLQLIQGDGTLDEMAVDDGTPGTDSLRCMALFSGLDSLPALGPNTIAYHYRDNGTTSHLFGCGKPDQGSRPVGFVSGVTDDRAGYVFAVRDIP